MILLNEVRFHDGKPWPVGQPRFLVDSSDNGIVAEWLGWTSIDCPDGVSLRGCPPEKWMNPGVRWSKSTIRRLKSRGWTRYVPSYCWDEREWYWVSKEIEARGVSGKYGAVIDSILDLTPGPRSWNAVTMSAYDKAAALLIVEGHPILTYEEKDAERYPFKFELLRRR